MLPAVMLLHLFGGLALAIFICFLINLVTDYFCPYQNPFKSKKFQAYDKGKHPIKIIKE